MCRFVNMSDAIEHTVNGLSHGLITKKNIQIYLLFGRK